ncbi:MAG TPA: phosphatase PAP2 family protein [Gaiellaceae bacterium]|nr:phosphatase PAP2 family protein [Gaiellaceae bacterium]
MRLAALFTIAGFGGATAAVHFGVFKSLDQWSIDHLMPWLSLERHRETFLSEILPFTKYTPRSEIPAELWLYPASVLVSGLVTAACCFRLWRSSLRLPAFGWASAWLIGNAIEVVAKATVRRPTPHLGFAQLPTFVNSFPSGHAIRALLLVAVIATVLPRLRWPAAVWLAASLVLLVITNAHLPSDLIGAAFVGAGLSLACLRLTQRAAGLAASDATDAA